MKLPPFRLDQWLAAHEFATPPIRHNLASSTGPRWTLGELMGLEGTRLEDLDGLALSYAPPEGSAHLREQIAAFHEVDPDWVLTTTGAAEALSVLFCQAAAPGASVVLPFPVFPAMPALAQAFGLKVRSYSLDRKRGFIQTAAQVLSAVDESTRLVVVNTPHNPTGAVMSEAEMSTLAESLAERRIGLLVDEVYHPLYFGNPVPSATQLPNTIIVSDLSKAFCLSGLRVGWIVDRDPGRREQLINLRSYFTVSGSPVTEMLAAFALSNRAAILSRLNTVARTNLSLLTQFMQAHRDRLGWVRPAGGTVTFPWLLDGTDSRPLCEALARGGVLVAPGDCFDAPEHFRVGVGAAAEGFQQAVDIASRVLSG